jgi:hypothetical protein
MPWLACDLHGAYLGFAAKGSEVRCIVSELSRWSKPHGQAAQNELSGSFRNAISSAVESRFSTALRCGKRPNRSMISLCAMA